jgi:hypothetical protein
MMHSIEYGNAAGVNNNSDDSTNDLFSPSHGRRTSLHQSTPEGKRNNDERLPRLQDTSWIGAKVSPINSYEDDEEEEDFVNVTAKYHKALNESSFLGANESTSLLLGNNTVQQNNTGPKWSLHPLWDPEQDPVLLEQKKLVKKSSTYRLGLLIVGTTGCFLSVVCLHDLYLWYISFRTGTETKYSLTWKLPWLSPSTGTLIRFGAFYPQRMIEQGQYWRILSSWFVSTSIMEWALIAGAWRYASSHQPLTDIIIWPLFFMCAATGQLWMAAFHLEGISGVAGWGTCGVLCAVGVSRPDRRFALFMLAIALVMLHLLQPTSSVYGAIGASFFGWSFYSVGLTSTLPQQHNKDESKEEKEMNLIAALIVITLWVLPILYVLWMNGRKHETN